MVRTQRWKSQAPEKYERASCAVARRAVDAQAIDALITSIETSCLGGSDAADRGQQNRPDRSAYGNGRRLFRGVATS